MGTPQEEFKEKLDEIRTKYGRFFHDEEQLMYFAMIPISDRQRPALLKKMVEEHERERIEQKRTEEQAQTNEGGRG